MTCKLECLVGALIITGFSTIVNAGPVSAAESVAVDPIQYCGKKPNQSCREFVTLLNWLVQTGKSRTDFNDKKRAPLLKLPAGGFAKARGAPGESSPDNPDRICSLLYDKDPSQPKARPVCLVINTVVVDQATHKVKELDFKIALDGKPDSAITGEGKLDDQGEAVTASGRYQKLSIKTAEIKAQIEKELAFWIKRANDDTSANSAAPKSADSATKAESTPSN